MLVNLILKMNDSWLQGVSANAYQLQLNNSITRTVDSLSILAKSCPDLNQNRRDKMKDQFQRSLRKLTNHVPAGSALLFGDDLAGQIRSLNNTTSLMKPTKMITSRKVFSKNPKIFQPFQRSSAYGKKGHPRQSVFVPEAKQTLKIQADSVGHSPIYDLSQKVKCFTAGNIHNHLSQWKSITSDPFIIDIVKSNLKLRFAEEPAQNICHNMPVTKAEKQIISDEIQKLLQKQVMYPCMREEGDSMPSIFTWEKSDGSHKMTLNLKQVNKHIDYEHFKMFWIL